MRLPGILAASLGALALAAAAPPAGAAGRVRAVTVDPSDYLASVPDASAFARTLVARLASSGVDRIYLNAYNVEYGAYYRTSYRFSEESAYGRQDLLGKLLAAAHARGIEVYAALYDHQHRGAWEARPGWREQTRTGGDYNPPVTDIQYYLSPGNPAAVAWWHGFLRDLLRRYPDLDGVELREPIVNWWGTTADYNPAATRAFERAHPGAPLGGATWRRFRAETLTRFLHGEVALVHREGRRAEVTTVADTYGDGRLMSAASAAWEVGFDLDGLLAGPQRPDAVKVELIWQQWAALYGRVAFTPEWTRAAAKAFLAQVRGRAPVIVHVELTEFGRVPLSVGEFARTLGAADLPGAAGVDFYSAALADAKRAWPAVRAAYGGNAARKTQPWIERDRRALVLYDAGPGAAPAETAPAAIARTELLNLLGHFDVKWETAPVERYRRGGLAGYDAVFYLGSVYGNAPQAFLSDVSVFGGTVVWVGENLFQLAASGVELPLAQPTQRFETRYDRVRLAGATLPARGEAIPTAARRGARVLATLAGPGGRTSAYVVRRARFYYVAGSPFSFLADGGVLNGRYLAFAGLLGDMLGVPERRAPLRALLRVEDVNPLTPPAAVRAATGALAAARAPFSISVTPFYVDPRRRLRVSLSQRPALVDALRDAVAHGGSIVLHGGTHQLRGRTGVDAEFWDLANGGGVRRDGEAFVRPRVERALAELWANDLHPLAWETPHYLATAFDYGLFDDYFSTSFERRVYGTWLGSAYQQPLPFPVASDVYGAHILPENLGYVAAGERDADALVANARALRVVPGAVAGGFVHVGTSPETVARLVRRLRALGYRFADLAAFANAVEGPRRAELTGGGTASLPVPSGWYLQERVLDRAGRVVRASVTRYPSYARVSRSGAAAPRGGIVSVRVLTPAEGKALAASPASAVVPQGEPGRSLGSLVVHVLLGAAIGGLGLLALAYVLLLRRWRSP